MCDKLWVDVDDRTAFPLHRAGTPVDADALLYTNFAGLAKWLTAPKAEQDASTAVPTSAAASGNTAGPACTGTAREAAQDRILNKILDELIFNSRPEVCNGHLYCYLSQQLDYRVTEACNEGPRYRHLRSCSRRMSRSCELIDSICGTQQKASKLCVCAGQKVTSSCRVLQRAIGHSADDHWLKALAFPQVRCAGCVWLLSLVSYTACHPRLLPLLPDIQDAFSHLLGDSNELTQVNMSKTT